MRCTMFWHGGSSYAMFDTNEAGDAVVCNSIAEAKDRFAGYVGDSYTPCVSDCPPDEGGPEAWLFFGKDHPVLGGDYPDRILKFGPRGGVIMENA